MSPIERSVAKVRRRVLVNRALRGLGWAVLGGLLGAAAVLTADKLLPLSVVPMWFYGVIGGFGVLIALAFSFRGLPGQAEAAVLLDEKLGLKDCLGTSLYTAGLEQQNELTAQIAREADQAAQRARTMVGKAAPIGLTKVWNWTPLGLAALLGVYFFLPAGVYDPTGQVAQQEEAERQEELQQSVQEVIINTIDPDPGEREEEKDQQIAEGLPDDIKDQLVSISDEMRNNPSADRAEELRQEAESLISDAEDRLGDQVDVVEATYNPLQNDASALDAGQQGPADQFTQAMNRGDFAAAQDAIEQMQEQIDSGDFTEQQQQELQQQLNNLSQQLQQQANNNQHRQQQQQQQAQQQMQQQLQQQGMNQQQAQQLSQQMANQMQNQQNQQNQQGQQQQQGSQQQQQSNQQGQQGQQGQQQQQANQQGAGQQQQQGAGQQQGPGQQQMQQQLQQALQQQGMSQQQAQQQAQQMMQQMQQQMQQARGQGQSGQMQQQLGQGLQQMAQQLGQQGGQPGQQPGQQPGGQQGQGQGQGGGMSAQQAINQMAQMQQQLQRMQQQQGQMQQAMNQLNQMQQNPGGGQGPGWGTGDGGNPYGAQQPGYQHQSYAANDIQQGEGRVIASWLENGEVAPGEAQVQFNASRTAAVQAAERAVTEDRVPRRYHEGIKDYFQQLPDEPGGGGAPAAPR